MISAKLIIAIIVFISVAVAWVRIQWGRSRNKSASRQIVKDIVSGKHDVESYADALNIGIWSAPASAFDKRAAGDYLQTLRAKTVLPKISVEYAVMNENAKGLVIGEGTVEDRVHDRKIDVHYPLWLYIDVDTEKDIVSFKSTFPENKDQHYLLEDLSRSIYEKCKKS